MVCALEALLPQAAKAGKKKQLAKTVTENIVFFDIRNPFFLYSLKSSDWYLLQAYFTVWLSNASTRLCKIYVKLQKI